MNWRTLFKRRNDLRCAICHRDILPTQRGAMIMGMDTWDKAAVHRDCLPARIRPAHISMKLLRG